jgi:phosphoserine phosphatase
MTSFHLHSSAFRRVLFDCDSSLTAIQGVDELARLNGPFDRIADLTRRVMDGGIMRLSVTAQPLKMRTKRFWFSRLSSHYFLCVLRARLPCVLLQGCGSMISNGGLRWRNFLSLARPMFTLTFWRRRIDR